MCCLGFLMQAGFKCVEVGMVREKHMVSVAMKNLIDWSVTTIVFYFIGYGFMFGTGPLSGLLGLSEFYPELSSSISGGLNKGVFLLFQMAFAGTTVTIVSGAMSERTGFVPYLTASIFCVGFIYPVMGHWAWGGLAGEAGSGWLADLGFYDFAGSTVVHSTGAWISLAGLKLLGPRIGRYDEHGNPKPLKHYNIAYTVLGVLLLWLGWWGFNGGSMLKFSFSVIEVIINTNIAGAMGCLAAYFHCKYFQNGEDIYDKLIGGALGGLVGITASANIQSPATSVVIGIASGIVHNYAFDLLSKKWKVDDAVGAIAVHGFCGATGTLLVVIAPNGDFDILRQFFVQLVGVLACLVWSVTTAWIMFRMLRKTVGLRVSPQEEREGISIFNVSESPEEPEDEEIEELLRQMR
ncbi:MAG: ammonium transporter [Bacteroidota bacterium]